jgi:FtsZ-binding cell division protein ZapB
MSLCSTLRLQASLLIAVIAGCGMVQAQTAFELQELNTTLQVAAQKIQTLEAQIAAAKEKNGALSQSVVTANQQAQDLKDRYERLRGMLEGLGIAALENNRDQTQDRLLSALSDLRISETSRQGLAESLMELAESSLAFAKTVKGPDPVAADRLQKALVRSESALAAAANRSPDSLAPVNADLTDARVVSLKDDLGIAVIGVGARDGIKPGMPFEIYREDKPIAKVLITEVRNTVSGAVIQDMASTQNPVRIGDRAKISLNR